MMPEPDVCAKTLEPAPRLSLGDAWELARRRLPNEQISALNELFDRGLSITAVALRAFPERLLDAAQWQQLNLLLDRRAAGEPLAYVLGRRGFWSLDLEVDPSTLIPRVETERLVELCLQRIPADAEWQLGDLGTGSGAIALALARERPRCRVLGVERSLAALQVAKRNAKAHRLQRVRWLAASWLQALAGQAFNLLVSNPPYIAASDSHLQQGDLRFEPRSALSAGEDGLDDIRQLVASAPRCLRPAGWLLLEHGWDQGEAVRQLLQAAGYIDVATEQDLELRDRVSMGRRP